MDESQQKIAKAYFYMSLIALDRHKKLIAPLVAMVILALVLVYVNVVAFQTGRLDYFIFLLLGGLLGLHLGQMLSVEIESMTSVWANIKSLFAERTWAELKLAESLGDMSSEDVERMYQQMQNVKAFMDNYGKYVLSWVPLVLYLSTFYGIYGVSRIAYQRYGEPVLMQQLAKAREVKLK